MFGKILIANRGEIACRIIKTARRMGLSTVAVYSDADRDALHVEMADESICIGPPSAAQSYLDIEKMIAACRKTGAEAIHPGYGFLSERASFSRALQDAGIVFIGPNPAAIDAMGDKIQSKKFAKAAGVTTVPGFLGEIDDPVDAVTIADSIGYPVMIKASAGGGGKGMRIVYSADEVEEGFVRARSEAASSFGDDRVFIEKFIVNPRHIEIQLLGDKHGNLIYLGERECSIQRRNQKVIEEAPSPLLDEETRQLMGEQAVALGRTVGYDSAGTVEFVVSQDKSFYFLEMNTRLQVEHPVTELITGVDLVEEMIRIAAGEPLRLKQQDIRLTGWAVESRVYAEDPMRNFMPSTGRIVTYRPPAEAIEDGVTIRNDTGVYEGSEISIHYDPMIAKLITHASSRAEAIVAQADALDAFAIEGIRHNIPFLSALMANARWQSGELSTSFIADEFPGAFQIPEPRGENIALFAAIAISIDHRLKERRRMISGQMCPARPVQYDRDRCVVMQKTKIPVSIVDDTDDLRIILSEQGLYVSVRTGWHPGQPVWYGHIDDVAIIAQVRNVVNGVMIAHRGFGTIATVYTNREAQLKGLMLPPELGKSEKQVLCPMPGLVKRLDVEVGQEIKSGEVLCVVEAMKMENVLRAERDGIILKVLAREGDSLAVDAVILEFA